jgi:hypothetical protein
MDNTHEVVFILYGSQFVSVSMPKEIADETLAKLAEKDITSAYVREVEKPEHVEFTAADSGERGTGLTLREVRDALCRVSGEALDKPFVVVGRDTGYDFTSYVGPAEDQLRIGTRDCNRVLVEVGDPIMVLQDDSVLSIHDRPGGEE